MLLGQVFHIGIYTYNTNKFLQSSALNYGMVLIEILVLLLAFQQVYNLLKQMTIYNKNENIVHLNIKKTKHYELLSLNSTINLCGK